jgi:hypothetical protein
VAAVLITAATAEVGSGQTPAGRPPVTVEATVEPGTVTIGTSVRYTLRLTTDELTELIIPSLAGQIGAFQVVDFGGEPPRREGDRVIVERWFTLVTYQVGDQIVPGLTIQYRVPGAEVQSVVAPDTVVVVQSLVQSAGATPAADIRDIKGPVAVPHDYRRLWWLAAALILVAVLGGLLYRWFNRPRRAALPPARPAHEVALEALTRLHTARLLEAGKYEEFYVRLSAIVRAYLESRFLLRAPEMTTEEFLAVAQHNPQLAAPQRGQLSHFLAEADLVKFARHRPAVADAERAYVAAREFVQATAVEVPRAAA